MRGQPAEKQDAARTRNWGIRNLRALHAMAHQLSPDRRMAVQRIIDEELVARGALSTKDHCAKQLTDGIAKERRRQKMEIPF